MPQRQHGLWLSYLFVLFYFAIAAGAVTHRDLPLENPVKLPFLNVELPLKASFVLGPLVSLIVHARVLLHFVLLAGKVGAFDAELKAQIAGDEAQARLRRQCRATSLCDLSPGRARSGRMTPHRMPRSPPPSATRHIAPARTGSRRRIRRNCQRSGIGRRAE